MINLSLNELKLIAQIRHISDYENKSKEDLIKGLNETKPETPKTTHETKPKTTPKQTLKPETKIEVKVNSKKFEKLRKDFDELRYRFSNKDEIMDYRKVFHIAKNYKHLCESEIKKKKELLSKSEIENTSKDINKLKISLKTNKFQSNIDSVDYEDLDDYDDNYDFADDDEYREIGSIRTLFREFDSDYYKPIRTNDGFAVKKNNYIECKSKGDDMKIYHLKNISM